MYTENPIYIYLPLAINEKISSKNYSRLFAHNFSKEYLHKADKLDTAQLLKHLWLKLFIFMFLVYIQGESKLSVNSEILHIIKQFFLVRV